MFRYSTVEAEDWPNFWPQDMNYVRLDLNFIVFWFFPLFFVQMPINLG